ncbi:MAG: septum formation initiator family protein [Candidatus Omnitrophota bacterium]
MLKIFRQTSFLAAVGILLVIFIPGYAKIQELRRKNQELEASVRKLQVENSAFQREKERLENDPEYLEQVGRKELGIVKKGEIAYRLVPQEKK